MEIKTIKNTRGWLIAFCTFLLEIPTTGIPAAFGVIYVNLLDEFNMSSLLAGWIGSATFGILLMASPISTGLFKRFGHRVVILAGVTLCSLGLLLSSFLPHPIYLFVTYSLMFGLGANFIDNATMNSISQYFPRKNSARASCMATFGWSIGSLALNPLMVVLCSRFGWRTTFQILAVAMAVIGYSTVAAFQPPPIIEYIKSLEKTTTMDSKEKCKLFLQRNADDSRKPSCASTTSQQSAKEYLSSLCEAVRAPGILLWSMGNILLNLSLVFPFINMMKFMEILSIPQTQGAIVLIVLSVGDLVGRGLSSLLGDILPFHTIYLFPMSSMAIAVAIFILLVITSLPGMIGFAITVGIFSGVVHSMAFKVTLDLFGNALMAEAWTFLTFSVGFGFVCGPVVAGAIFDATGSFDIAFYIGGGSILITIVLFLVIPFWQKYKNWVPKKFDHRNSSRYSVTTTSTELVISFGKEPIEIVDCLLTTV